MKLFHYISVIAILMAYAYSQASTKCGVDSPPRPMIIERVMSPPGLPGLNSGGGISSYKKSFPTEDDDLTSYLLFPQAVCTYPNCERDSCSFTFEKSPYQGCDTSCKCINPCDSTSCSQGQVCTVTRATDNGYVAKCVTPPTSGSCPKLYCSEPACVYGYVLDSNGCQTCECKHPCKDFGCRANSTCQLLPSVSNPSTLEPKCVVCPKLTSCPKIGVCPNGLAKDQNGCDVCECKGCDCTPVCSGNFCLDYRKMDSKTGCQTCPCESVNCNVSGDVVCPKSSCQTGSCKYGLELDDNGCYMQNCACRDPCKKQNCQPNSFCKMSADDCPPGALCRDAPMPYCEVCPNLSSCTLNCPNGLQKDPTTNCSTCQCAQNPTNTGGQKSQGEQGGSYGSPCAPACPGMICPNGKAVDPATPHNCSVPLASCDQSKCPMGIERDQSGCPSATCGCHDICKGVECPMDQTCVVTDQCPDNNVDCRDRFLRQCPPINCQSPCRMFLNRDTNCYECDCTYDLCANFKCPENQRCQIQTQPECDPMKANCRDGPMRMCVDNNDISMTTKTYCPPINCPLPCSISSLSPPSSSSSSSSPSCPICQCPDSCNGARCNDNDECVMVLTQYCNRGDCPRVARCLPKVPAFCSLGLNNGQPCGVAPVNQWYYSSATQQCELFSFTGCKGNENRFPTLTSCTSACVRSSFNCQPLSNITCPIQTCKFGYKLDENGCKMCTCIDPCENYMCPYVGQRCSLQSQICIQPPCDPTFYVECHCPTDITCPHGRVGESCECYDPCSSVKCGANQLCSIVEQGCDEKYISEKCQAVGVCVDGFLKRNMTIKINASYDDYVLANQDQYNSKITQELALYYDVAPSNIAIIKNVKGSIITTAQIIFDNGKQYEEAANKPIVFNITINNTMLRASISSSNEIKPQQNDVNNNNNIENNNGLSEGDKRLIILLCVLIPVGIIITIPLIFIICKKCMSRGKSSSLFGASLTQHDFSDTLSRIPTSVIEQQQPITIKHSDMKDQSEIEIIEDALPR
ncbi:hypothetical protein HELRODRAFT_192448 [Helobdella robusta]|uniref:BPTI/Kunitz inhibitor domain-containing protein n=1 Tax=Helobdella robusta TaxID=6412 RepID=T1FTZ1_HELRO|nr:hypothetical protein HELRODRAFT_192448 [Helobdella robusta]ESO00854.1 hypothetical protein HELRODRAFT_192448 [Helobdella robusta]